MNPIRRPGPGTVVTVVGLAKSGVGACRWLLGLGAIVRATEIQQTPELETIAQELIAQGVMVELGRHTRQFVEDSEILVVSPGVASHAPPLQWAQELGIPTVSELELGSWYCSGRMVAVTGSNGKSTVVTLLAEVLRASGLEVIVCGNIGFPITEALEQIHPHSIVVLEVSSFQLETSLSFSPEVACVLNVTDNHLDRHRSFKDYWKAKGRIFAHQKNSGWALLNRDDPGSWRYRALTQGTLVAFSRIEPVVGACLEKGWLTLTLPDLAGPICSRQELPKQGKHHEENALAVAVMAGLLGIPPETIGSVFKNFEGLPHRQEVVGSVRGVTFINDSKSTTVASGIRAIDALLPGKVILIAGGRDKGSDFRELRPWARKLKAAILFGEDAPKIATHLKGTVTLFHVKDLKAAVGSAFGMAQEGEWVLLSPMCTSFDMFQNFEERGERFTHFVRELA